MIATAPARICICGEHQDYLGHPVIAGAVDLYFSIQGEKRPDRTFIIHKKDLGETERFEFPSTGLIPYNGKRDYFRSALNVLKKQGIEPTCGAEVEIHSEIPINAGSASSSVMVVAWLRFLTALYQWPSRRDHQRIAEMAYLAEVEEFGEPGGKMDHFSSALGGIHFLDFAQESYQMLKPKMSGFVLVNSREKKDTIGDLKRIKAGEMSALAAIRNRYPEKNLLELEMEDMGFLAPDIRPYGYAAVINHQLTIQVKSLFLEKELNHASLGAMFSRQHETFRRWFRNTTQKIDDMIDLAMEHGALGGKMNGSGSGGTFFIYCPGREEQIIERFRSFEVDIFKISICDNSTLIQP